MIHVRLLPARPPTRALRPRRLDTGVAVAALGVALALQAQVTAAVATPSWLVGLTPAAVLLLAAQVLPYAWRTSAPVAVLALTAAPGVLVTHALHATPGARPDLAAVLPQLVPGALGCVLVCTVAARRPPRWSGPAVAAQYAADALASGLDRPLTTADLRTAAGTGLLWGLGHLLWRRRRARADELRGRVAAVREAILRELHDVVIHHVSALVVQAGAGRSVVATRPDVAHRGLTGVAATAREALAAMRRMLAVLRQGPDGAAREEEPTTPGTVVGDLLLAATPVGLLALGHLVATAPRPSPVDVALAGRPLLTLPVLAVLLGALLWRRRHPAVTLAAVTTAVVVYEGLGGNELLSNPALLVAAYAAGAHLPWRHVVVTSLGAGAALAGATAAGVPSGPDRGVLCVGAAVLLAVGVTVRRVRSRRDRHRRAETDRAVGNERVRISRELHDVVAHHLTGIVVQASAAALRPADDRVGLEAAVADIDDAGRDALLGLRRLLEVLRGPAGPGVAPQPGLDDVDVLVDGMRRAGLEVDVNVEDVPGVDAETGLFAYRILQEALTNCLKHAPGAAVSVDVGTEGADLVVAVRNGPPARAARPVPSGGQGLIGMRERVELLDGRLDVGPDGDGGWFVRARLPRSAVVARNGEHGWASAS